MAGERPHVGGFLPVPNVQHQVASGELADIPDRYIRPEMEGETVEDGGAGVGTQNIPVVDLRRLLLGDPPSRAEEAAKLKTACEDWGFFQLVNHGVADELMERMKTAVEEFFDQPLEEKLASSKKREGSMDGYGQALVVSEEQKLDWGDVLFLVTQPPTRRNHRFWPTHPQNFRATLEEYSLETKRVSLHLLGLMAGNLGLSPEMLTSLFTEGLEFVRMNYYPPCKHHADKVLGLSPHSDGGCLTLLLQTSPVPGLQVRRNGRWLAVNPLPGAFVVNIGDMLEIMSNGQYKSIEHRAVVDRERRRLSVASSYRPGMDGFVGPLPELTRDGKPLYKTLSVEEFLRQLSSRKLQGKNFLDSLKLTE